MSRLMRLLGKSFARPRAVTVAPSSVGWRAFRKLQEQSLAAYQADENLIASARRLRNTLVIGATAASLVIGGVAIGTSMHMSAAAATAQRAAIEPFEVMENLATELYLLRGRGVRPDSVEVAEVRRLLDEAARAVGGTLKASQNDPEALEVLRARLDVTLNSDLGRVAKENGVDMSAAIREASEVAVGASPARKESMRQGGMSP